MYAYKLNSQFGLPTKWARLDRVSFDRSTFNKDSQNVHVALFIAIRRYTWTDCGTTGLWRKRNVWWLRFGVDRFSFSIYGQKSGEKGQTLLILTTCTLLCSTYSLGDALLSQRQWRMNHLVPDKP